MFAEIAAIIFVFTLIIGAILMYLLVSKDQGYGDSWLGVSLGNIRKKKAKKEYRDAINGDGPVQKKQEPNIFA